MRAMNLPNSTLTQLITVILLKTSVVIVVLCVVVVETSSSRPADDGTVAPPREIGTPKRESPRAVY